MVVEAVVLRLPFPPPLVGAVPVVDPKESNPVRTSGRSVVRILGEFDCLRSLVPFHALPKSYRAARAPLAIGRSVFELVASNAEKLRRGEALGETSNMALGFLDGEKEVCRLEIGET